MKSFSKQIEEFVGVVKSREALLYDRITRHVYDSIVYGSKTTGAPGQPVKTGDLLRSWNVVRRGIRAFEVSSSLHYAHIIEDNRRKATLRSRVGGFHSVKITYLNYRYIVRYELRRVKAEVQ